LICVCSAIDIWYTRASAAAQTIHGNVLLECPSIIHSREVEVELKAEVRVKAMHFEMKAMHCGLSIIDHGSKIWPIDGKVNQG